MHFLVQKGENHELVRSDLENQKSEFSFTKMLTLFVGCVSPRSLDGLIINSRNNSHFINAQTQSADCAVQRLVNVTEFEKEGWKRILTPFL